LFSPILVKKKSLALISKEERNQINKNIKRSY